MTVPTTQKEQIRPKTEVKKEAAGGKATQAESTISKPVAQPTKMQENFPKVTSETYLFSPNEKRLSRMKILALVSWQGDSADLTKRFEEKGMKIAKIPQSEAPRALEVGIVDGVLTTSKDLIDELKKKFPEGVILRNYTESSLTDSTASSTTDDKGIGVLKVKLIEQNWGILPAGTKVNARGKEVALKRDVVGVDLSLQIINTSSNKTIIPEWILLNKNNDFVCVFRLKDKDGKNLAEGRAFIPGDKATTIYLQSTYKGFDDLLKGEPLFLSDRTQNVKWQLMPIPDRATLIKNRQSKIEKTQSNNKNQEPNSFNVFSKTENSQVRNDNDNSRKKLYITDSIKIPLRSGPNANAKILGILTSGQKLKIIDKSPDEKWSYVSDFTGKEGWVLTTYLLDEADGEFPNNALVTNKIKITLRDGPGSSHKVIGILESGEEVGLLESGDEWTKVSTKTGLAGWAMTHFLQ